MRHRWMNRIGRWLVILPLALVSVGAGILALAAPVRADADGIIVTLSTSNGTSFAYDGTQPLFKVVVTFSTKPTVNNCGQASVKIDGTQDTALGLGPSVSSDGLTWTYTQIRPVDTIPVGSHTAVATFYVPGATCTPIQSSPFNFTVNKATVDMACRVDPAIGTLVGAGQSVGIQMSLYAGGPLPSEWLSGAYNVTFDGPTHVTYTNLTSDSNFFVTVTAPSQIGLYILSCAFNGSASYAPSSITSNSRYMVSAMHSLGVVKLYTNPTTLVAGRSADFYVAFHPASGLPMPTGQFSIWLGQNYTNAITLGPTGTYLIHFQTIPVLGDVSRIEIFYMGDKYYNRASVYFPLTNPPIPSGTNAGGSGSGSLGANPQGTATAQGTPSETATTTESDTPTAVSVGKVVPTTNSHAGDNGVLMAAIIIAVLVALGFAAGIAVYLIRRRALAASGAAQVGDNWPSAPRGQWDAAGRWNPAEQWESRGQGEDDMYPYRRGDR